MQQLRLHNKDAIVYRIIVHQVLAKAVPATVLLAELQLQVDLLQTAIDRAAHASVGPDLS